MAFTLGRPPSIHQCEIRTKKPNLPKDFPGAPEYLYTGVIEFSIIIGEMYMQLFFATGRLTPREVRNKKARAFAIQLASINSDLHKSLSDTKDEVRETYAATNLFLGLVTKCLTTIAYHVVAYYELSACHLKCSFECVQDACRALTTIVRAHEAFGDQNVERWTRFLNL
ncbi:hypothetical protein QSH57_005005 [Fusarium oxysporum f. sp. vasinfectum]|nr:hypothetical protein QSH57_005005 [Fusarium oxysporum f. sp. vasinfectum]